MRFRVVCKFRVIGVTVILLTFLSINFEIAYATEEEKPIYVTYEKEGSEAYPLSIRVSGSGSLVIENDTLRNEEKTYLLTIDESKVVKFQIDKEATIKNVILNNQDVKQKIKDNKLIVEGNLSKQSLSVEFQESTNKPSVNTLSTGDFTNTSLYIVLLLFSFGALSGDMAKKNKFKEHEVELKVRDSNAEE